MASFLFELVSPEKLLFTGEVEEVVVPGTEGEFTVLKDHAPLMSTLKPGVVTVGETAGKRTRLFVRGGFADVAPTGLTILAEMAVPVEELDAAKIEAEMQDAREDVADAPSDESRRLAQEKLDQLGELRAALQI
ncbi:MAG TPA: F0F1 ATP synthase subunit epsilon [Lichenihabitans sp.]|jgi:F-type H+-transporting ATPase subunit epsilon|nr:F0F1 ATP synthase subunit epsilon [Lichenihabitans sp.]